MSSPEKIGEDIYSYVKQTLEEQDNPGDTWATDDDKATYIVRDGEIRQVSDDNHIGILVDAMNILLNGDICELDVDTDEDEEEEEE